MNRDVNMSTIEQWVKHGDEMRRPLLVHPKLGDSQTVIIVGGGLSGMCCAYQIAIKRPDVNVVVIEQSNRLGE